MRTRRCRRRRRIRRRSDVIGRHGSRACDGRRDSRGTRVQTSAKPTVAFARHGRGGDGAGDGAHGWSRACGFIPAAPPPRCLTGGSASQGGRCAERDGRCSGGLGAITLVILPVEAVDAFSILYTFRQAIIRAENVGYDTPDPVIADARAPVFVLDGIVDADVPGVALRFHRVAAQCAPARGAIAGAHEDGVGGVAEMVRARVLAGLWSTRVGVWRDRKTQASGCKGFGGGFKGGDWEAEGEA